MTPRKRVLRSLLAVGLLAVSACTSSPPSQLRDEAGHTCSMPDALADLWTSCGPAPAPAQGCTDGLTPCWTVGMISTATEFNGPAAICASCCDDKKSLIRTSEADCSQIVCATSGDCPAVKPSCTNGSCR